MGKIILLFILGISVFAGGCVPFGIAIYNSVNVNSVFETSIDVNDKFTTPEILVHPIQALLVSIEIDLSSTEIFHERNAIDNEYRAKFRFPLHLEVRSHDDKVLYQTTQQLAWDQGARSYLWQEVDSRSARVTVEFELDKILLQSAQFVYITGTLSEDCLYYAKIESASVTLFDNVYLHTTNIAAGIGITILGLIITILALVLMILKFSESHQHSISSRPDSETVSENESKTTTKRNKAADINNIAMLCHLSTFAGMIIPFGGILGPLIVWINKKELDPMIDQHGKAAVNFHLSMMIYYFISFILIFVVIGFFFLLILMTMDLIFTIIACIKANEGTEYRYPFTIRFIQ